MKLKMKRFLILCLSLILVTTPVYAGEVSKVDATDNLCDAVCDGFVRNCNLDEAVDYSEEEYKLEGGGFIGYSSLTDSTSPGTGYINETNFEKLTTKEQKRFLSNMIEVSNNAVADEQYSNSGVTDDTQTSWLNNLQNCAGVGTTLMNTILENTKPDYVTANRIYEPFSGVVGTILGLGAILLMAFIAITMVLDLAYIGIPTFRMLVDGDGDSGKGNGGKPKFISYEAVSAVQMAEGGNGGSGQDGGSNKVAVGIYFKKRVIMLILLGVCLLYLIQGEIFTLVGWILDLVSGFLGF